jgi:hypothetical protein
MWTFKEGDYPANGSNGQKLEFAHKYAALAPTEGNSRSWDFQVEDAQLELLALDVPALEEVDPDRRESLISCGAALLCLKLALRHFGCLGRVALFPELDKPALVARVHFGFCRERDAREELLFETMNGSRAKVSSSDETPASPATLAALSQAVSDERGWLDIAQSEASRQRVMDIRLPGEPAGMNFGGLSNRPMNATAEGYGSRSPRRFFVFGGRARIPREPTFELVSLPAAPAATLAVVKTKTDDKHGWVTAGQTLARTALEAQALGVSWGFFNSMRRREARAALRMGVGRKGFAQVILRLGSRASAETARSAAPTRADANFPSDAVAHTR